MGNNDKHPLAHVPVSRRRAIQSALAASGITLAGCLGDDDDDDDDDTVDPGDDDDDDIPDPDDDDDDDEPEFPESSETPLRHAWERENPAEMELNPHNAAFQHELSWPLNARMGSRNQLTGEWYHLDIEYWEVDDDAGEMHIRIKDDTYWTQGGEVIDDLTAEDWKMQHEMEVLMTPGGEEALEDDLTVAWHVDENDEKILIHELNPDGYNTAIMEGDFGWTPIHHYRDSWMREYYEQLQDTPEDDRDEIREDVIAHSVNLEDDPPLSGPYFVESVTPAQVEFRRNPDHWSAEVTNWDYMHLVNLPTEGDPDWEAAQQDEVDVGWGVPTGIDQLPDHLKLVVSPGGHDAGECMAINYSSDNVPDYMAVDEDGTAGEESALIRQAIAHAIDYETVLLNNAQFTEMEAELIEPDDKPFPMNQIGVEEDFPDVWDAVPSFIEQDFDAAEDKLERAGLEDDGDEWVTPDGDPLTLEVSSFSWSREAMDTIVGHLQEVGINAEHRAAEDSVLFSDLGEGSFAAAQTWTFYEPPLSQSSAMWTVGTPVHWDELNNPSQYEVPPIGEYDASPTETIDPEELSEDFELAPEEEHRDEVEQLLWTCAYHLPAIPLYPLGSSIGINERHFQWPEPVPEGEGFVAASEDDHPLWGLPQMWREPRRGIEGLYARE